MLKWMKRRQPDRHTDLQLGAANVEGAVTSNRLAPFHKYLNERFADAVVLTFAEIEDLAGCPLPERARLSNDWWTTTDSDATRSRFADSWIQANRTARPNLGARTVLFDRAV